MALKPSLSRLTSRRRTRAAWATLAFAAVLALGTAASWLVKQRDNAVIASGQALQRPDAEATEGVTPALAFAQAHELAAKDQLEAAPPRATTARTC
jgi:hypothetical protein